MEQQVSYILLVVATALIFSGIKNLAVVMQARRWVRVPAVITSLSEHYKKKWITYNLAVKYYFPTVEYEYEFNGKRYRSNRVSFRIQDVWVPEVDKWGNKTSGRQKIWNKWTVGASIPVFVDPKTPQRAVVTRDMSRERRSHSWAMIVGGALCLIAFSFVLAVR